MQRDARSCRRPATARTPRWRGLPPTSPRSRVAGPCSGSSATRVSSTPHWIETSPTVPGMPSARPQPMGASSWPPCVTGRWPTRASSDGLWGLGRMAALRTRPCHTGVDRRRAARVRHHDAARPGGSADRPARRTSSDRPIGRSPRHLRPSVRGIVHRLRYRRRILDGDRCAASALPVRDARRHCDRDVGGFDRDRRRHPHPRRLAISGSGSADGGPHAVPFRRRTDRDDRIPAEGLIAALASCAENASGCLGAERIIAGQACFRPVTQDGLPLIGRVPQIEGAYVATGHNVWGILNAFFHFGDGMAVRNLCRERLSDDELAACCRFGGDWDNCYIGVSYRSGQPSKRNAKMFQLFSRAPANQFFKARSAGRNTETDQARAASIFRSIEDALEGAKAEQAGLKSRIDDVLARAAVTLGNDSDEYLTRDPEDNHYQNLLGAEIVNGQRRLNDLGVSIGHFQFLRAALVTRFPDFKLWTPARKMAD